MNIFKCSSDDLGDYLAYMVRQNAVRPSDELAVAWVHEPSGKTASISSAPASADLLDNAPEFSTAVLSYKDGRSERLLSWAKAEDGLWHLFQE